MIIEQPIQVLTWIMTTVGFTGFIFAGQRKWWAWYINLACQILWAVYALATGQMAFLAFAAAYFVIFGHNAYKWTKDHLVVRKIWKSDPGTTIKYGKSTTITKLPDAQQKLNLIDESNLIKHARHELELIGEEPAVIDWYLRVIKEYSSFGHSGGSAWATIGVLDELLRFHPLTELTDDPEEWDHIAEEMAGQPDLWQNKRDGRCFSNDGGVTYHNIHEPKDEEGNWVKYDAIAKEQWLIDHVHVP
ncbi:hypothetical protein SEA_GIANTSBANE_68 [Arthrobacter phage Giantsbane]|nr:hypothetical protein SEA_GIANTSBANE_68 [Arthrobacter phage Giantsbane]